MLRQDTTHTETVHNPDGSVITVTIRKNDVRNSAQIITTTQNRSGMSITTTQTTTLHTEQKP